VTTRHHVPHRPNDYKVSLCKDLSALQLPLLSLFRSDGTVWPKYKYGIEHLWQTSQISPDATAPETTLTDFNVFNLLTVLLCRTLILNILDVSGVHYLLQVAGCHQIPEITFYFKINSGGWDRNPNFE